ncbi:DUF6366 family protein [Bacillus solimangrovi]|uniref:Phage capsid protein n=1 Tax=Bacillus solimangrovi TaxID=1305675 RepID=A0A1E5LKD6_9BACI|nr:DUF6366 family protein [Bacillus solimangrovi]OEH94552.1 hypothetical protein BFG57_07745 [Bacillus solimangrovi]
MKETDTPKQREKLRQEELKSNRMNGVNDGLNRAESGSLVDLAGSIGWRGTGLIILGAVIVFVVVTLLFK